MADGLTTIPSNHSVKDTIDRLEAARVDHAMGAHAGGTVWLACNDPDWIAARHGITRPAVKVLAGALAALTKAAGGS